MISNAIIQNLAHNLRFQREEYGFSQGDVARKTGLSQRVIQNIESGKGNPTLSTVNALASLFNIMPSRLISLDLVRTEHSADRFLTAFSELGNSLPLALAIRNYEGIVLNFNETYRNLLSLTEEDKSPLHLLSNLPDTSKEILKVQLESERRGLPAPYVNYYVNKKTGETLKFRFYPCMVLPHRGRSPYFTIVYLTDFSSDCQKNYFDFCSLVYRCAYIAADQK